MMEFINAITKNDIDKVRTMLQSGIDVNSSFLWNSKDTYSPVIPSDRINRPDLLNNNQEYQCKPLNIAVLGGHADMTRLLLSAGADINSKDGRGRTALVCAIYGLDLDASNINTSNLDLISQTNPNHFDIMKDILMSDPNLYYATLDSPQYEIKGITPLCLTSYLGKTDIIQLLLDDGRVNVDGTDSKNATALMYAARDGTVPVVKILLRYNASPDITDSHGWSAIQYAERNPEIVQLCEQVLRVKRSEYTGNDDVALRYPLNYNKLSHLINTMPNYVSSLSHIQFDTLHDLDILDPSTQPLVQVIQAAFLQAIKVHDHLSLQTLLMKPPTLNSHQTRLGPPLLINHHDPKTGLTPFHHAMRTKPLPSLETIKLLYHAGADMNAQTYYGRTALHHLARFGMDQDGSWGIQKSNTIPSGVSIKDIDVPHHLALCASLLIRLGALVNIADPTGNTPLHFAAEFGGIAEVIEVLILEGGADIHVKNKKGSTPLDVCKSEELKSRIMALDGERKTKTRSIYSTLSGTIRPFDSASEYNRTSLIHPGPMLWKENSSSNSDFEIILKSFFNYQTTFTDSIESALAYLTDSVIGDWTKKEPDTIERLEKTTIGLRLELREAHEMFDVTDGRVEKVMMAFREELEEVEGVHQADWEMSELQHDKIEKLFDVFERIDGRYCGLELLADEMIDEIERLRKAVSRRTEPDKVDENDVGLCIVQLSQTLFILQAAPVIDGTLHVREDKMRLCQDIQSIFTQVVTEMAKHIENQTDEARSSLLKEAKGALEQRWFALKEQITKNDGPEISSTPVLSVPPLTAGLSKRKRLNDGVFSLNQLELSFDILHTNLFEIQRDLQDITEQTEKITACKKSLYDLCLSLEKELDSPERPESEIKAELSGVLYWTQQMFNKKHALELERAQLLKEHAKIEKELEETRHSLRKVRPPVLLQGLLERLDTDDTPLSSHIKVEKDWKEDVNLVMEIVDHDEEGEEDSEDSDSDASMTGTCHLTSAQLEGIDLQCTSKLSTLCYLTRLDASLYCLKVLTHKFITRSRQHLLEVQAVLAQASTELEETRHRMTQLYDDAAEVARQVFALKTELETIVRHRKEEVVKVWEVVDEVSESVKAKIAQCPQTTKAQINESPRQQKQQQQQQPEDQDRHQWIIRELEQLQHAYESLQAAVNDLKEEQAMIGQNLKQLASNLIEPQVNCLVGQDPTSLLSVSDQLTELIERVKEGDLGTKPLSFWSQKFKLNQDTSKGSQARMSKPNNRLSCISAATQRLPNSTSGRTSFVKSPLVRTDKKRLSVISATSLSSLSSYQQEKMIAKVSNLSHALSKAKQQDITLRPLKK
ncbi:hypothetical protein G6F60_000416 [Rhizopus arrhizus]|nr:hypothetical protein G6F24_003628 [Rhizopus arrhizus]KAG0913354.1 hypothetical protein G6F33_005239 [Rhizopus arrhizus]KAG1285843.1 hypothetical protein G6F66_010313 [Rhizopus arrhizus]KAG1409736.1 hypothetical protein G6F60_000416 [Rhizopus arrhizus]